MTHPIGLQPVWPVIRQHFGWFLLPVLLLPTAAALILLMQPAMYQATTRLLYTPGSQKLSLNGVLVLESQDVPLESLPPLLESPTLSPAVAKLDQQLHAKVPPSNRLPLSRALRVSTEHHRHSLLIRVMDPHPETAQALSQGVANLLSQHVLHQRTTHLETLLSQVDRKLATTQKTLTRLNQALALQQKKQPIQPLLLRATQIQERLNRIQGSTGPVRRQLVQTLQAMHQAMALQKEMALAAQRQATTTPLLSEHQAVHQELLFWVAQRDRLRMAQAAYKPNIMIVGAPKAQALPRPWGMLAAIALLSPLMGLLLVVLAANRTGRLYQHAQVEKLLGVEILQEIHREPFLRAQPASESQAKDYSDLLPKAPAMPPSSLPDLRGTRFYQDLLQLKSRLQTIDQHPHRIWTVLSPIPSSTGALLTVQLAGLFVEAGLKTLVIDGNLRQPELHEHFQIKSQPGLCELVTGKAHIRDVMYPLSTQTGFFAMPSGTVEADPTFYLAHPNLQVTLQHLKGYFDVILLNSPASTRWPDGPMLANLSDGTLLNLREADATLPTLQAWRKQLTRVTCPKLGLVLQRAA